MTNQNKALSHALLAITILGFGNLALGLTLMAVGRLFINGGGV